MNMQNKHRLILVTVTLFLFGYCGIAGAQLTNPDLPDRDGIEIGPATLHGAFETSIEFDTNIFLSDKDEKFDIITLLHPSAGLEFSMWEHNFSFDYDADVYFFGKYTDENHVDHRIRGLAEINYTYLTITFEDEYNRFSHRSGSEDTNRIEHQDNEFKIGVAAELGRFDFEGGYTLLIDDYRSSEPIFGVMTYQDKDRLTNSLDFETSYRFLPKTSLLLDVSLGVNSYASSLSSDSYYVETLVGARGGLRQDLTFDLKGGLRCQNYEGSHLTVSNDFIGFVCEGNAEYYVTDKDVVTLELERTIYESTYADMNYYAVNLVSGGYTHMFNDKISAGLQGYYQFNLYPTSTIEDDVEAKRHDHLFGGRLIFRYDIRKWVAVEARYDYKQRESKFSTFDYIDNIITLRGVVGF